MEIGNQLPLNEETKKKLADLVYLYIISSHFEGKINIKAYRDIYYDINNYLEYMAICAYFAEGLEPEKKMSELIIYDENEL